MNNKRNFDYYQITEEEAAGMTKEHILSLYNDAVAMIWHLNSRIIQLREDNETAWKAYDEISDKYLG